MAEDKKFVLDKIEKIKTIDQFKNIMLVCFEEEIIPVKLCQEQMQKKELKVDCEEMKCFFKCFYEVRYALEVTNIFNSLEDRIFYGKPDLESSWALSKEKLQGLASTLSPYNKIIFNAIRAGKIKKILKENVPVKKNSIIMPEKDYYLLDSVQVIEKK